MEIAAGERAVASSVVAYARACGIEEEDPDRPTWEWEEQNFGIFMVSAADERKRLPDGVLVHRNDLQVMGHEARVFRRLFFSPIATDRWLGVMGLREVHRLLTEGIERRERGKKDLTEEEEIGCALISDGFAAKIVGNDKIGPYASDVRANLEVARSVAALVLRRHWPDEVPLREGRARRDFIARLLLRLKVPHDDLRRLYLAERAPHPAPATPREVVTG
jgi:hypothetical protein